MKSNCHRHIPSIGAVGALGLTLLAMQGQAPTSAVGICATQPADRRAALAALLEPLQRDRKDVIAQMLTILKDNPQNLDSAIFPPKALAIQALGELKAVEALPDLVAAIEYNSNEDAGEATPFDAMPAARALHDIGLPAVQYVLRWDVLADASPERLRRIALVIRYVFPDAKTARAFFDAYDVRYTESVQRKHDQLRALLAELH